jgi:hypothetical protein
VERLDIEGHFWLPEDRDNRVAGKLIFDPDKGGELSLIGSLDYHQYDASRIIGVASDGLHTLEGCFMQNDSIGTLTKQRYYVNRLYSGVEYEHGEEPAFDEFALELANLAEWAQLPRISEDWGFGPGPDGREQTFKISLNPIEPATATVTAGRLSLIQTRGIQGDGLNERRLTQGASFKFAFDRVLDAAKVVDVASDLQDLVSIGTDTTADFVNLHLFGDQVAEERDGKRYRRPVRLQAAWHAKGGKKLKHPHDMAFTLADIGGIEGVGRWLEVAAAHRSVLGRVMNSRYVWMFVDDRFLHRIASLEALHKAWSSREIHLVDRLREVCDLAGAPVTKLLPDVDDWCVRAKGERNNVAHHLGRPMHQDSTQLFYSSEVAYWVFVLCMLRLADAPDTAFDRVVQSPSFTWLRDSLRNGPVG